MNTEKQKHIITALVTNRAGVLTRISGLFARRGYNIDSLSVCGTHDPDKSRMTIVAYGGDDDLEQIIRQLDKLIDCIKVKALDNTTCVKRELLLIKVKTPAGVRGEIESTARLMKVKIVDVSVDSVICEMTGESNKVDKFIELMRPYGIMEMIRTGLTALSRGDDCIENVLGYTEQISVKE